jgi:small conductance mechanosensitive channel
MLERFNESLGKLIAKLGEWLDALVVMLPNLVLAAFFLGISIVAARYLKKAAQKGLTKTGANGTVVSVLSNIIVAAFMLVSLFIVLNILNLDDALTALLGTAGVAGLAVGLALQDPLVNLFSGVLMSVKDYYKVGDLIETNGYFGKILKITLRATVILTPQGQEVVIPNKEVLQSPMINFSHNGRRRIDISCGVAYGDDLERVKEIAVNAIANDLKFNDSKPVELFFNEFGDSSINFTLRFWKRVTAQADYLEAQSEAIISLKKAFDKEGITIPFPIRTLDLGVVGGLPIHEVYPPEKIFTRSGKNGQANTKKQNGEVVNN